MFRTFKKLSFLLAALSINASANNIAQGTLNPENRDYISSPETLGSNSAYYLSLIKNDLLSEANADLATSLPISTQTQPTSDVKPQLEVDYNDTYNKTLFSTGDLNVERVITVNGGGTQIRLGAFELGLHLAVKYTL